jgi:uncharacterized damage-inducible protein DinB
MTVLAEPSPALLQAAVDPNVVVIRQGIALLAALGEEPYTRRLPLCYNASVGGHIRHIIEHYQSFLDGLTTGEIDYEKRARDPRIEGSAAFANEILAGIIAQLRGVVDRPPANRELHYCAETSTATTTSTSILRELEFLLSHTIHHYALIAVMARLQGCEPPAEFGIAPSTLKFQQSQAQCAR